MLAMFRQFIDNPRAGRVIPSLPLPKDSRSARPFGAHDATISEGLRMGMVCRSVHRAFLLTKFNGFKQLPVEN